MDYNSYFSDSINKLKDEDNYRQFLDISRICGDFPHAINNTNNKKIIVWCSNDYLGLGQNQDAIKAAQDGALEFGVGSGGTRNISGTNHPLVELEEEMADLHKKEMAIIFSSGYVANESSIKALAKIIPDLVVFSDEKNHASIIHGIKNSGLKKHIFKHNDMSHLENLLSEYDKNQPKVIIFESVYSMDGDFGNIEEIKNLAKKYNALTYVDEVHGVGLYGQKGSGLVGKLNLEDEIDIIQGTFGKAYGGIGGYIAGNKLVIDAIRSYAAGFIFTTAMPPMTAKAILNNVKLLKKDHILRQKHQEKVKNLKEKLEKAGIGVIENQSHIISIIIGDAALCKKVSQILLEKYDIYVQNINFPTVERGSERLRIIPTPLHSDQMIVDLVVAISEIFQDLKIKQNG